MEVIDDEALVLQAARVAQGTGPAAVRLAAAERVLDLAGEGGYLEWCEAPWAGERRTALAILLGEVALVAAQLYAELGRPQEGLTTCRRAIAYNPLEEEPRLALCRQLVALGRSKEALAEYRAFHQLLKEELGAAPSSRLRTLIRSLLKPAEG